MIRAAFVVVLAVVLAANLVGIVTGAEVRRYERSSDSAYAVARDSPYKSVRFTFGTYHYLRNHMAGKRLTIPPQLHGHTWFLQRVSRLQIDTLPSTAIAAPKFRKLRGAPDHVGYLRTNGKPLDLYYQFGERSVDHYVVTQNPQGTDLMIMPAQDYEALAVDP